MKYLLSSAVALSVVCSGQAQVFDSRWAQPASTFQPRFSARGGGHRSAGRSAGFGGRSGGVSRGFNREGEGHSEGKINKLEKLEVCQAVLEGECRLDFEVPDLLEELALLKEQAMATGSKPDMPEGVKASLEQAHSCLAEVAPALPEDDACRLAVEQGKGKHKHGKGPKGGKGPSYALERIEACQQEIEFDCALDFEVTALIDALAAIEAEKEAGVRPVIPEEVKAQLEEVRQCVRDIQPSLEEDSECKQHNAQRPRVGGSSYRKY